jgi:site-specific recombinase XerC
MVRMKAPTVSEAPAAVPSDDCLRRLLKVCGGSTFEQRRDQAILRLFLDAGLRLSELTNMTVDDVERDLVYVTGKGERKRAVVIGTQAQLALDRYRRVRRQHPFASFRALWLGGRGVMTTSGVTQVLQRRCVQAEVEQLHPHQLRHYAAHRFLAEGGTETSAQRIFGWRSRDMLARCGAARADERAADEKRRLSPGDRLSSVKPVKSGEVAADIADVPCS